MLKAIKIIDEELENKMDIISSDYSCTPRNKINRHTRGQSVNNTPQAFSSRDSSFQEQSRSIKRNKNYIISSKMIIRKVMNSTPQPPDQEPNKLDQSPISQTHNQTELPSIPNLSTMSFIQISKTQPLTEKSKKNENTSFNNSTFKKIVEPQPYLMKFNENDTLKLKRLLINITGINYKSYFSFTTDQYRRYLSKRYPERLVYKLVEFLEFSKKLDLMQYLQLITQVTAWSHNDLLFLAFYLMDFNTDGVICPQDIFILMKQSHSQMGFMDFRLLSRNMISKLRSNSKKISKPDYPELYFAKFLTSTLFFRTSKKLNIMSFVNAKKNTIYHLGFYGLTHNAGQRQEQEEFEMRKNRQIKKFDFQGEFYPSNLGELFENVELCCINYSEFKEIYSDQLPFYFYEILFEMTLYQVIYIYNYNHIKYQDIEYFLTADQVYEQSTKV